MVQLSVTLGDHFSTVVTFCEQLMRNMSAIAKFLVGCAVTFFSADQKYLTDNECDSRQRL